MDSIYNDEFEKLNCKQKQIVKEISKNVLLMATAGTGKTNSMALRISNILLNDLCTAEEILCLTFTNRACKEMKERVIPIVGNDGFKITIKTFHSFCYSVIISEAKKNIDLLYDTTIFDEEDCKELIKDILKEFDVKINNMKALQWFIDFAKESRISHELKDYNKIISLLFEQYENKICDNCLDAYYQPDINLIHTLKKDGAFLLNEYDKNLRKNNGLDFNDLLFYTHELLKNEAILDYWQKRFKYLHIDEAQDTSENEYKIISKLFAENNVMLCADYYQTIYEWRGSVPKKILNSFKKEYSPNIIFFNKNYRSTRTIINASNEYLSNAFGLESAYNCTIEAESNMPGESITLHSAENVKQEATWIYYSIKNLGIRDFGKAAVLTRSNKLNEEISAVFEQLNSALPANDRIPFILVEQFKFFKRKEVKDILAFIKIIINRHDEISFKRILVNYAKGIGEKTIDNIENAKNKALGIRLTDFLIESVYKFGEPYQILLNELKKLNVVVFDVETTGTDTTKDEIIQIAAILINEDGEIINTFERFIRPSVKVGLSELVHGFSNEFLAENGEDKRTVLEDFVKFIDGSVVVGHNINFDLTILTSELKRLNITEPIITGHYDTLDLARRFYPNLENYKLATLCEYFKTKAKPDHNALNDIIATAEILIKMLRSSLIPILLERKLVYSKYVSTFSDICNEIIDLVGLIEAKTPCELASIVIERFNIYEKYIDDSKRIENINGFMRIVGEMDFTGLCGKDCFVELLKITSLSNSELDQLIEKRPSVPIITVHQSKGGEFDFVFLAGLMEYTFPSYQAIKEGKLDEEKRVFYVAITRAKKRLTLSWSKVGDRNKKKKISSFIKYLPDEYLS